MGKGNLLVQVTAAYQELPLKGAEVRVLKPDGTLLHQTTTDDNGNTDYMPLSAPDYQLTLDPDYRKPAYSVCNVEVRYKNYVAEHIHGVQIADGENKILPVVMHPYPAAGEEGGVENIYVPPLAVVYEEPYNKTGPLDSRIAGGLRGVIIPEYITVHLGHTSNVSARNVRVRFADYVANSASHEIYSTWPYNSLVANIYCIITFALNRIYTEWYRSRGFPYDITNSTAIDQMYVYGGGVFQNIAQIVNGIFNNYAKRTGFENPYFTQYCNGSTVTCPGLSQWGTVTLANRGMSPLQILHYYYPKDLHITTAPVAAVVESFPGYSLSLGSRGEPVQRMQNFLNRIRLNGWNIPAIARADGVFGVDTQTAVRAFQRAFSMTQDGVIGRATWNKITQIYVAVTRLGELNSEGVRVDIGANPPAVTLFQGSTGENVRLLQFILTTVSQFYNSVPPVVPDGTFGAGTKTAVIEFQKTFGLTPDGAVGATTWNKLYEVYRNIKGNVVVPPPPPPLPPPSGNQQYPGTPLRLGSTGSSVTVMQNYLNTIRVVYPSIPQVAADGVFGTRTEAAVRAFQQQFMLTVDGVIGPVTWTKIVEMFNVVNGNTGTSQAYPGTPLRLGSTGSSVRLIQQYLNDLRKLYPSLPMLSVDGVFGPMTQSAVVTFQRLNNLSQDGIVGPITWNAIISRHNSL